MSEYISYDKLLTLSKSSSSETEVPPSKIIEGLKNIVKAALQEGFDKNSYLIKNHISYIKRIQNARNPEAFIRYTARKLVPNEDAYCRKVTEVNSKYDGKISLISAFINIYDLYYNLPKNFGELPKRIPTKEESEDILAELLAD